MAINSKSLELVFVWVWVLAALSCELFSEFFLRLFDLFQVPLHVYLLHPDLVVDA